MIQLANRVAKKSGKKFDVLYIDLEAQYKYTIEQVYKLKELSQIRDFYHSTLPIALRNDVSVLQPKWICWKEESKHLLVRDMPKDSININNSPFSWFKKGEEIVAYYDKEKKYIVVDGFHGYRCAKEYFNLKKIPVVTIDKDLENRMATTIRHNRARGTHQIIDMSHIVLTLTENGCTEKEISKHLGMELDEIIRLKQITGLKDMFANHKFSKSWEEFEVNRKKKTQ